MLTHWANVLGNYHVHLCTTQDLSSTNHLKIVEDIHTNSQYVVSLSEALWQDTTLRNIFLTPGIFFFCVCSMGLMIGNTRCTHLAETATESIKLGGGAGNKGYVRENSLKGNK